MDPWLQVSYPSVRVAGKCRVDGRVDSLSDRNGNSVWLWVEHWRTVEIVYGNLHICRGGSWVSYTGIMSCNLETVRGVLAQVGHVLDKNDVAIHKNVEDLVDVGVTKTDIRQCVLQNNNNIKMLNILLKILTNLI